MAKATAVIIGNHTQGLGILRSAGVAGHEGWVVNESAVCLARFSRYLAGYRSIPNGAFSRLRQDKEADHLVQNLLSLPIRRPALLFPVNEDIGLFIHEHREPLREKYFIPDTPMDLITDKYRFSQLVPPPAQIDTRLWSDPARPHLTPPECFIMKGRQGTLFRRITGRKAIPLDQLAQRNIDGILSRIDASQVIAQRLIESDRPVLSVCSLAVDGRIHAEFQYEKLREHPARFGTGTYLRTARVGLASSLAAQILSTLNYTGISEIECIFDPAAGAYKVIEMNPRTWKSVHFATQCGRNLVAQYLSYVATGRIEGGGPCAERQHWVDLLMDLPQMLRARRVFDYEAGFHECLWDRKDPWPAMACSALFPLVGLNLLADKLHTLIKRYYTFALLSWWGIASEQAAWML